jgi:hypothetical protein
MNTNQWVYPDGGWNTDGSTVFFTYNSNRKLDCSEYLSFPENTRGDIGVQNFYQSRGYTVTECYTQPTDNKYAGGFSFAQYMAEIDAGRPVMFHVEGHTMVGVGYNTNGNTMYIHDTWDYSTHAMSWGGSYSEMAQFAVTIVKLATTLTVQSTGATRVTITGSPATYSGVTPYSLPGISSGTLLSLTAPASSGGIAFSGWSGCTAVNGNICTVAMTTSKTVTASYGAVLTGPYLLLLNKNP